MSVLVIARDALSKESGGQVATILYQPRGSPNYFAWPRFNYVADFPPSQQDNLFESFVQNGRFVSEEGVVVNNEEDRLRLCNVKQDKPLGHLANHVMWALLTVPPLISYLLQLVATGSPYVIATILIATLIRKMEARERASRVFPFLNHAYFDMSDMPHSLASVFVMA